MAEALRGRLFESEFGNCSTRKFEGYRLTALDFFCGVRMTDLLMRAEGFRPGVSVV